HDVRVVQPGGRGRLSAEPIDGFRGQPESMTQNLQRHPPVERSLDGLIHDTHPPAAELASDLEVAQNFALQVSRPLRCPPTSSRRPRVGRGNSVAAGGVEGYVTSGIPSVYAVAVGTDRVPAARSG